MALPFFYLSSYDNTATELTLDEDNSRHIVQVLRMQPGEALQLTDGKGALLTAVIVDDHKKKCRVRLQSSILQPSPKRKVIVAISLLKNASRFEWFLEKATEIGVSSIIPLLCERTEKQHARTDRLRNILVSAMLQSQQTWLPDLPDPMSLNELLSDPPAGVRFIAHCLDEPQPAMSLADWRRHAPDPAPGGSAATASTATASAVTGQQVTPSQLILIGPEGDFSPKEIESALKGGFLPVTLGDNRLRTETAGVVAATLLCIG
ncbi:MAG TPA: 16S rRNA (uracil(1498)-N(3))-methyltransferase [Puia sp.]|nr:16S rRNA (uracil(1498)-N(3))-methyltransferase [Puia sp.]